MPEFLVESFHVFHKEVVVFFFQNITDPKEALAPDFFAIRKSIPNLKGTISPEFLVLPSQY